ncbi:MAG TPA: hypothetical protein PLR50_00250 [Candidatus Rifleibacterium sp.]|nr:hypothetical protein [Candidatus Rifleibacterium sp.]
MYHFDYIPPGKKPVQNAKGEWELVDMKDDNVDDLRAMNAEKDAIIKDLEGQIDSLKAELAKFHKATVGKK